MNVERRRVRVPRQQRVPVLLELWLVAVAGAVFMAALLALFA